MCFEVKDMEVLVDVCPAEPDVGSFGNGKVSISILDVGKLEFDAEKLEYYNKSVMNELTPREIDEIVRDVYSQMEENAP
jgi:hypothetical protein